METEKARGKWEAVAEEKDFQPSYHRHFQHFLLLPVYARLQSNILYTDKKHKRVESRK
jgi:hypothetical protein